MPRYTLCSSAEPSYRELFAWAADAEAVTGGVAVIAQLREALAHSVNEDDSGLTLVVLAEEALVWVADETERFHSILKEFDAPENREVLMRRTLYACAPLGLFTGAWLQWLSTAGNADSAAALRILTLYASDIGVGRPRASRGAAFADAMRRHGLGENIVPAAAIARESRAPEYAFTLPALLLAFSRYPEEFAGEILGADLCLRTAGLLPALGALRTLEPHGADWAALDLSSSRDGGEGDGVQSSRTCITALLEAGHEDSSAIRGFRWALVELRRWSCLLRADLDLAADPAYEMGELLRVRAREGAVYHHGFKLGDRSLAEWLKQARCDPHPLLDELARSRLIRAGDAEHSPLANGLIGERGPMFRIFSPEDVTVIRRWIDSLPGDGAAIDSAGAAAPERRASFFPAFTPADPPERLRSGVREAYHLLQTRNQTPALRDWAERYVLRWLARSRSGMTERSPLLLMDWPRAGLRTWLAEQHDRHGEEFERDRSVPLPSREDLIDSTVQLAPLTLIDGSWLQGFTDYELASSEVGYSLFETYWDELGNGKAHLNHPLIYREILGSMGVEPPPTGSAEFAHWPGFRDESFELPVYWLCIGRFPETFRPEVLGLNLAMELSGVGGSYRRARLALKHHGFSTRFVDIHNTIDNVATGHSAWAADAVDAHMATVPALRSFQEWQRVRTGYRSLNPPTGLKAWLAGRRLHPAPH